jgi:predicted dienelactone hydrolase
LHPASRRAGSKPLPERRRVGGTQAPLDVLLIIASNDEGAAQLQKRTHQSTTNAIAFENARKSTKPIVVLPLITVWLQIRVLPGPPFLLERIFPFLS